MSAGRRLQRALEASASAAGCAMRVAAASEHRWASATFVGARHDLMLEGAANVWLDGLAGEALIVPGHVVAEFGIAHVGGNARITALTLED